MSAIRRILVAVKELQATSHPAVLKAAQLARACVAEVQLFHSLATPLYTDLYAMGDKSLEGLEQNLRQRALGRLEVIADQLRQHSIKVTVAADWDFPVYEAIIRRALSIKADLIIVSRHSGRHTAPWLLRLTDWELVRLSPIPVLLVKNPHAYRHPAVLAAIDPTHAYAKPLQLDKQILHIGRTISERLRGTLHAVHAYARMPIGSVSGTVPAEAAKSGLMTPGLFRKMEDKMAQRALQRAKASVTRALRATRITASRRYVIQSDPISAIAQATRKSRSAIVVMGAISRSGYKRLLIGNTAERILDELSCDILVVKPLKFRCEVPRAKRGARVVMASSAGVLGYY
jgi:universal stress protein E